MSASPEEVVAQLCHTDLGALDVAGLQALAVQLSAAVGQLTGRLDQVLAELDERSDGQVPEHPDSAAPLPLVVATRTWWRQTATISGGQAGRDLRRAAVLRRLPLLGQAVTDGRLTPAQAAVLCRLDGKIDAADLEASQEQLVEVAAGMDPEALAQWVRHLVATHCEPSLDLDEAKAHDRRYLQLTRHPDGSVSGRFRLAGEDAEPLLTVLEPLARRQGDADQRSAGQRRADALVEVFSSALQWMDLPQAGGHRPQVSYVVPAGWAAQHPAPSLAEQLAGRYGGLPHPHALEEHCATGAWTGPQTRARLEAVLCDARISRVLLDPAGQVRGLEALRDSVTPSQRRALVARDRHCVARGCTRPPAFCDAHHLTSREDGGPTTLGNLVLLCRRHHVQWHRGALRLADLHVPWHPGPPVANAPPRAA